MEEFTGIVFFHPSGSSCDFGDNDPDEDIPEYNGCREQVGLEGVDTIQ